MYASCLCPQLAKTPLLQRAFSGALNREMHMGINQASMMPCFRLQPRSQHQDEIINYSDAVAKSSFYVRANVVESHYVHTTTDQQVGQRIHGIYYILYSCYKKPDVVINAL